MRQLVFPVCKAPLLVCCWNCTWRLWSNSVFGAVHACSSLYFLSPFVYKMLVFTVIDVWFGYPYWHIIVLLNQTSASSTCTLFDLLNSFSKCWEGHVVYAMVLNRYICFPKWHRLCRGHDYKVCYVWNLPHDLWIHLKYADWTTGQEKYIIDCLTRCLIVPLQSKLNPVLNLSQSWIYFYFISSFFLRDI